MRQVIGNHESTKGSGGDRVDESSESHYLNQTWGVVIDSTADTGLGHLLTKGTAFAAGNTHPFYSTLYSVPRKKSWEYLKGPFLERKDWGSTIARLIIDADADGTMIDSLLDTSKQL